MHNLETLLQIADSFAEENARYRYEDVYGTMRGLNAAIKRTTKARALLHSALSEVRAERDSAMALNSSLHDKCVALIAERDEWYEAFHNKRIECDALRQAWEGSKQIIKMLESSNDSARYLYFRNASDQTRLRLAQYSRDGLDEQLDIAMKGQTHD